jgi:hypothetical protein
MQRERLRRRVAGAGTVAAVAFVAACAPKAAVAAKKSAIFNVAAVHAGSGMQVTITSKVWITSTQARADVNHPLQGNVTFLVANGYFYQLDHKSKKGIRGPLPPEMKKNPDNFNALVSQFAFDAKDALSTSKKMRTETVSGYLCDVYSKSSTKEGASRSITVWMPQQMSPKFAVKAVVADNMRKPGAEVSNNITITLSNIKLNQDITPATFAVPKGYNIMTGKLQPPKAPGAGK